MLYNYPLLVELSYIAEKKKSFLVDKTVDNAMF